MHFFWVCTMTSGGQKLHPGLMLTPLFLEHVWQVFPWRGREAQAKQGKKKRPLLGAQEGCKITSGQTKKAAGFYPVWQVVELKEQADWRFDSWLGECWCHWKVRSSVFRIGRRTQKSALKEAVLHVDRPAPCWAGTLLSLAALHFSASHKKHEVWLWICRPLITSSPLIFPFALNYFAYFSHKHSQTLSLERWFWNLVLSFPQQLADCTVDLVTLPIFIRLRFLI